MDKDRVDRVRDKFCAAYQRQLEGAVQELCAQELSGMGMNAEMLRVMMLRLGLRGVERLVEIAGPAAAVALLRQEARMSMAELMLVDPEFGQAAGEEMLGSLRDQLGKELAAVGGEEGLKRSILAAEERRASKLKPTKVPEKKEKGFGQLADALKKAGIKG